VVEILDRRDFEKLRVRFMGADALLLGDFTKRMRNGRVNPA
jgi:hypothetical protein